MLGKIVGVRLTHTLSLSLSQCLSFFFPVYCFCRAAVVWLSCCFVVVVLSPLIFFRNRIEVSHVIGMNE